MAEEVDAWTGPIRTSIVAAPPAAALVLRVHDADGRPIEVSPNAALAPEVAPRSILDGPPVAPFDPRVGLALSFMPSQPEPGVLACPATPEPGVLGIATGPDGTRWRLYGVPLVALLAVAGSRPVFNRLGRWQLHHRRGLKLGLGLVAVGLGLLLLAML